MIQSLFHCWHKFLVCWSQRTLSFYKDASWGERSDTPPFVFCQTKRHRTGNDASQPNRLLVLPPGNLSKKRNSHEEKVNFHEFLVNNLKLLYVNKVLIWPCVLLNLHLMTQTFECSCCAETERRLASKHCQIRDVSHASRIWRRLKI